VVTRTSPQAQCSNNQYSARTAKPARPAKSVNWAANWAANWAVNWVANSVVS
jgi:hypothetical protein